MASLKCNWCQLHWPDQEDYAACPQCRELTTSSFCPATLTEAAARKLASESAFGWWLWDTVWNGERVHIRS